MKPVLRILEFLVLAQMDGNEKRSVKEELPVVNGIGAVIGEVEILDRVRLRDGGWIGTVAGGKVVNIEEWLRQAAANRH